jgi:hypothetical protein
MTKPTAEPAIMSPEMIHGRGSSNIENNKIRRSMLHLLDTTLDYFFVLLLPKKFRQDLCHGEN